MSTSCGSCLLYTSGIEALRDVVAESDSRLCDNFLQEIDRGVESHNNEDVIKGNCRTVHMHILDMQGECIYYRLKCNFMKRDDAVSYTHLFNVGTPVFDGANEYDIMDTLELANDYVNTPLDQTEKEQKIAEAQEAGDEEEVSRLTDIVPFEDKYKDLLDPEVFQYCLLYTSR